MMNDPKVKVFATPWFKKDLKHLEKKYRNISKDVKQLVNALERGETPGDQLTSTRHTFFKQRLKSTDMKTGQRDGYRVVYYVRLKDDIRLLVIYAKNEHKDVSGTMLDLIADELEQQLGIDPEDRSE
jgi:mRNA-degrading endonuclease RelE of RelBE toxin-antitoxin system